MKNSPNIFIVQIFQSIFSHKILVACIVALIVVSGMIVTFLITPKYESSMAIMISREKVDSQVTPGAAGAGMIVSGISDEEFNSELELLRSNEVITGAVGELAGVNYAPPAESGFAYRFRTAVKGKINALFGRDDRTSDAANPSPDEQRKITEAEVNRVASNLEVVPTKKSRIIRVSYKDVDPVRAKLILEKLFQKYSALHLQIAEKPQVTEVFNEQSKNYNAKLDSSTEAIKRFDLKNGLTGSEIRVQSEMLLKQYYDAQSQLAQTRTEITENAQRVNIFQAQINEQSDQIQSGSVTKYVGALDQMKSELVKLEQERTQLMQKYQPKSRFVTDINERIAQIERNIQSEQKNPPQERSFAVNDLKRRLIGDLYNAKSSLAALKQREKNLSDTMEDYRAKIETMNAKSIEREKLDRDRAMNEEAYSLYQRKARESEIGQTLQKNQLLNFALVDPPYAGSVAVSPKPALNFAALLAVGLFVGAVCAIFVDRASAEIAEDLIVDCRQIEARYHLPVLAVVPEIRQIEAKTIEKPFSGLLKNVDSR